MVYVDSDCVGNKVSKNTISSYLLLVSRESLSYNTFFPL